MDRSEYVNSVIVYDTARDALKNRGSHGWGSRQSASGQPDTDAILLAVFENLPWSMYVWNAMDEPSLIDNLVLVRDGCRTDSQRPDYNCTRVCRAQSTLFQSWATLWTCLTLSTLMLVSSGLNGNDERLWGLGDELNSAGLGLHIDLHNVSSSSFDYMGVLDLALGCLAESWAASCRDDHGNDDGCILPYRSAASFAKHAESVPDPNDGPYYTGVFEDVCSTTSQGLNVSTDIAGPGVLISYFMQAIIVLCGYGLARLVTSRKTLNSFMTPFLYLRRRRKAFDEICRPRLETLLNQLEKSKSVDWTVTFTELHPRLGDFFNLIEKSKAARSTVAFLADLQEAQCFFIIAAQIAILFANVSQTADFNGVDSWDGLVLNWIFIQYLANVGALPIIITQVSLCHLRIDSVYTLVLSTVAILLSAIASYPAFPDIEMVYEMFKDQSTLEQCGNRPSLTTYCVTHTSGEVLTRAYGSTNGGESLFFAVKYANFLTLLILWVRKGHREVASTRTSWFQSKCLSIQSRLQPKSAESFKTHAAWIPRAGRILRWTTTGFLVFVEAATATFIATSLGFLRSVILSDTTTTWNIGQIIAMLVWAPVLLKYIYTSILGIPRGFEIRLPNEFEVVEKDHLTLKQYSSTAKIG